MNEMLQNMPRRKDIIPGDYEVTIMFVVDSYKRRLAIISR